MQRHVHNHSPCLFCQYLQTEEKEVTNAHTKPKGLRRIAKTKVTRIIQSLYYAPAGRYINAWMHSLKKSAKPERVNRYDLWIH
jgi:hypothetical protein